MKGGVRMIKTYVYKYKLTTLTPVIISPRQNNAFYTDALIDETDMKYMNGYKIIYPFYRYGEYERFKPDEARYYIPGSSIKGALTAGMNEDNRKPLALFVDDISVDNNRIEIIALEKFQYASSLKSEPMGQIIPKFNTFFPGVGVEALKKGTELYGALRYEVDKSVEELFKGCGKRFKGKLERYKAQLEIYEGRLKDLAAQDVNANEAKNKTLQKIDDLLEYCKGLVSGENKEIYIFLGGFKGLIRSVVIGGSELDINKLDSAVFVSENNRPFGIVKIKLESRL
ncbi:MAG: hypothetical protein LBL49_00635 [Clostridiales Family XIII bacterium]|nr:hypothetical protein [Clostridiales Family XIII bacterium]